VKIDIAKIHIKERIRKDIGNITEFAEDIKENGLLNAITVMRIDNGYQLLAGLRRLKAVTFLGLMEIEANIVDPKDAEAALRIEISENEQRKPFTFSEKAYFGKLLADVEKAKAVTRMAIGGKGGFDKVGSQEPTLEEKAKGRTTDRIGKALGVSRATYERINYLAENAPQEIIDQLDRNERSIKGSYNELRAKEKAAVPGPVEGIPPQVAAVQTTPMKAAPPPEPLQKTQPNSPVPPPLSRPRAAKPDSPMDYMSKRDREAIEKLREFDALPPEEKITELQRQLREERARAAGAEAELTLIREQRQNDIYHKDANIENLKGQIATLKSALAEASARIIELEEINR